MLFKIISKEDNLRWLKGQTKEYRSSMNDTGELIDDFDEIGQLGQGFLPIDELSVLDIGVGGEKHPTYMRTNLTTDQNEQVC
jgi:hypothetical protein